MTAIGKYRLTAYPSVEPRIAKVTRYVGALVCNVHDHETFESAQDCLLESMTHGRPEVVDEKEEP